MKFPLKGEFLMMWKVKIIYIMYNGMLMCPVPKITKMTSVFDTFKQKIIVKTHETHFLRGPVNSNSLVRLYSLVSQW